MEGRLIVHFAALLAAAALGTAAPDHKAALAQDPYMNQAFVGHLNAGLTQFYARQFDAARAEFTAALAIDSTDSLALSLLNAAARNAGPEALAALTNDEEDWAAKHPRDPVGQTRLGYSYLFEADAIPERNEDAKDAFNAAIAASPTLAGSHVGLGIYRLGESSTNRAKSEFLAALANQKHDVLALEYLAGIYQNDLRDPQRALGYLIDVPNLVKNYADAYFHIGSIMDDLGQYDAAVSYLKTSIDIDKGHVGEAGQFGLPLLGDIYLKLHKTELAKKAYADAIAFGEEPEYSRAQLQRIKTGKAQ